MIDYTEKIPNNVDLGRDRTLLGAELEHLPLLLLFIIFFAADAGRVWGLDGVRRPVGRG